MRNRRWRSEQIVLRPIVTAYLLLAVGVCAPVDAQILMVADSPASAEDQKNTPGFQIPVDDSLATSFSDFERHSKRGDWEKAFRSLSEIPAAKRKGMLRAPKGMIVPAGRRIWNSIARLPAEGREAFRVFYDAQARNLWKQVGQPGRKPADDEQTAVRIYEEFFLTTVGDDAANYLGDAAFEQGRFQEADRYWKAVLDHHPSTDLGELRVQVKRALALLQSGQIRQFDALLNSVAQSYPGVTVTLGGEAVDAATFLKANREAWDPASSGKGPQAGTTGRRTPSGPIPERTETAWRLQFLSDHGKEQLNSAVTSNYWYRNGMETWIPPYVVTDGKLVCNWFGIVFAIDGQTGKLQWRSDKFDKIHGQFAQLPHSNANLDQFAVAASGDVVLANWMNPERFNHYREPFRLIAFEGASGKQRWTSEKLEPLKEDSFVGVPLIIGEDAFVTSHKRNESKLVLRSLKLADGAVNWSVELGTAQKTRNQRGNELMPLPALHKEGDTLYVLTNNGALVAVDLKRQQMQWALKSGTVRSGNSDGVFYSGEIDTMTLLHSYGVLKSHNGVLYSKEVGGAAVQAVDPSGPSLLWSRPIAPEAVLVGVDDEKLYLLSRELMAIDLKSQKLVWARRLPIEGGGLNAVLGDDMVYVCSRRGIYCVSRADGRLKSIFRGEDLGAIGAWIDVVGDRLVSISNTAITAYALSEGESAAAPTAASGSGP